MKTVVWDKLLRGVRFEYDFGGPLGTRKADPWPRGNGTASEQVAYLDSTTPGKTDAPKEL